MISDETKFPVLKKLLCFRAVISVCNVKIIGEFFVLIVVIKAVLSKANLLIVKISKVIAIFVTITHL